MVEEKDVETFLKAKRDQVAIDILQALAFISLATLVVLEAASFNHDYTIALATLSAVLMGAALGQSRWVSISRSELICTLERVINRDSEALKVLAKKRQRGTHGPT